VLAGVTLNYIDGSPKNVVSDFNGNYTITVPNGWFGTVIPVFTGYIFTPQQRTYSNVTSNQINQNYTPAVVTGIIITGYVMIPGTTLSYFDGTAKTVTANILGYYSINVPVGWTGTVTPSATGYSFDPVSRSYTNLISHQNNQDYDPLGIIISGNAGVAGASLTYLDGTSKVVKSNGNGDYLIMVPTNWSGKVTPSKLLHTFTPVDRTYSNLVDNQTGQDYIAILPCGTITSTQPVVSADLKSATWTVTNATPVLIGSVSVSWPAGSGNLTALTIDTIPLTGTFPASPTTRTYTPTGGLNLAAGTHQIKYTFGTYLFSGNFSTTMTFLTPYCSDANGSTGIYIVTHPIPFPTVLTNQKTSPNWTLTNKTGVNLQISSIVVTWEGGVPGTCDSPSIQTKLEQITLGSQTWSTNANNTSSCNGLTIIPPSTWYVTPGVSNMTLTFQKNATAGITVKIYLTSSSYIVDSSNPLQKD
jgi:hypothetical protein